MNPIKNNSEEELIPKSDNRSKKEHKGKKTGAKLAKKAVSAALFMAIGFTVHSGVNELTEYHHIANLISNYQEENACLLPSKAQTSSCYDMEIASGKKLVRTLSWKDIEYCRVNGEYFTQDGIDIAVISLEVTKRDTKSSLAVSNKNGKVYAAPDGYTIVGEDCYKDENEIITKVVPKSSNYENVTKTITDALSVKIVDVKEVTTKKYSEMMDKTLICDVLDSCEPDENKNYPGTLKLVP